MMATCRSCSNQDLHLILSLGRTPLANALLDESQLNAPEERFPLELVFCPKCSLVQITETVPPEKLFRNYVYFSSFSDTVLANARNIATQLTERSDLDSSSLVLEIASNDGYLLRNYAHKGIPVLGIEPALNVARIAEENGVPTVKEFFNTDLAVQLQAEGKMADVIHANNVVAHVADLHGVVEGISILLKPGGVAVVENHYVKDMIDHVEFDSIYHEHLCYYSVTSFLHLFAQYGLELIDVEHLPLHGGSLRVYFQRTDGTRSLAKDGKERVRRLLEAEEADGITGFSYYQDFGEKVEKLRADLLTTLNRIKANGNRIAVYGASAKSTTLLNYYGIGRETIEFVVDRSTAKQGYYTPGTHLPIFLPDKLLEDFPEYVLLLSWNFVDEILAQQAEYRKRGGRFIVPIPDLTIV